MSKKPRDVEPGPVTATWFEDMRVGDSARAGPVTVTADEITAFAARYDPLPMHVSDDGGRASVHESIIASGVLTVALKQRMIMSIERNTAIIGAARIEDQNFLRPVRAGDELSLHVTCVAKRESRTRPDRGLTSWDFVVSNQRGEPVFTSRDIVMVRRRPAG